MIDFVRAWTAAVASAIYWGVGGALFLILGAVLGPILPERTARRVGGAAVQWAFAGFVKLLDLFAIAKCEYVGLEKLAAAKEPYILAPNHPAIWDAVFVLAKVNGLTCVLKAALLRNPLVMGGARLARFIPNDPPGEMIKQCVNALKNGYNLLLFPEGTRTRKAEGLVNEFRGGVGIIARNVGSPVYPVYVTTDSEFGAKGTKPWIPRYDTAHIRIVVGDPLRCAEGENTHDFLQRLRSSFITALSRPPE